MRIDKSLIEITEHTGSGYKPLVDFESWRVAILNDDEAFHCGHTKYLERHTQTDEIFVLLDGECSLYISNGGDDSLGEIILLPMEKRKLYNVKKGVWHNLTSTPGTTLLIVENSNTSADNSDRIPITPDMYYSVSDKWILHF